jgi:hypothetical protein
MAVFSLSLFVIARPFALFRPDRRFVGARVGEEVAATDRAKKA